MSRAGEREPADGVTPLRGNTDFLLLWIGAGLSLLGARVVSLAYPLLVYAQTHSPGRAGLVGFAALAPYAVVQLPAGVLVDRWDRRTVMIACDAGRVLALGALVCALLLDRPAFALLMAVAFAEGSLTVTYRLAERAAVRNVVEPGQLPAALSRNEAREQAAGLLGRPCGPALFGLAVWAPFVFTVVGQALGLLTLLLIRKPFQRPRAPAGPRRMRADLAAGLAWVWREPLMRAASGLIAGSNLLFQALNLTLVITIGKGADLTVIVAVSAVGGMLGALSAPWFRRRASLRTVIIVANAVWAVLMPLVALTRDPVALALLFAGMGFAGAVWNVAVVVYQLRVTPDELQGRINGVVGLVAFGPTALGSLLAGYLLGEFGPAGTVYALSAAMAVLALAAVASPAVRAAGPAADRPGREERPPEPAGAAASGTTPGGAAPGGAARDAS
ncbi:MFS transporter [Actinomadura violacea]|uniref:MFS transporter n=1 Tax=Actinomadura violacea TaxID=2819934 RepID=A0ABS3RNM9_9ACTN|nr:MFS transporter [Actinomadura violacea]MBO2458321.1 MFS transporter [Actinomadura violacea]